MLFIPDFKVLLKNLKYKEYKSPIYQYQSAKSNPKSIPIGLF